MLCCGRRASRWRRKILLLLSVAAVFMLIKTCSNYRSLSTTPHNHWRKLKNNLFALRLARSQLDIPDSEGTQWKHSVLHESNNNNAKESFVDGSELTSYLKQQTQKSFDTTTQQHAQDTNEVHVEKEMGAESESLDTDQAEQFNSFKDLAPWQEEAFVTRVPTTESEWRLSPMDFTEASIARRENTASPEPTTISDKGQADRRNGEAIIESTWVEKSTKEYKLPQTKATRQSKTYMPPYPTAAKENIKKSRKQNVSAGERSYTQNAPQQGRVHAKNTQRSHKSRFTPNKDHSSNEAHTSNLQNQVLEKQAEKKTEITHSFHVIREETSMQTPHRQQDAAVRQQLKNKNDAQRQESQVGPQEQQSQRTMQRQQSQRHENPNSVYKQQSHQDPSQVQQFQDATVIQQSKDKNDSQRQESQNGPQEQQTQGTMPRQQSRRQENQSSVYKQQSQDPSQEQQSQDALPREQSQDALQRHHSQSQDASNIQQSKSTLSRRQSQEAPTTQQSQNAPPTEQRASQRQQSESAPRRRQSQEALTTQQPTPRRPQSQGALHRHQSKDARQKQNSQDVPQRVQYQDAQRNHQSQDAPNIQQSQHAQHREKSQHAPRRQQSQHAQHRQQSQRAQHRQQSQVAQHRKQSQHARNRQQSQEAPHREQSQHAPNKHQSQDAQSSRGQISQSVDDSQPQNAPSGKCKAKQHVVFLKTHKTASSTITNILNRFGDKRNLSFAIPALNLNRFRWPEPFLSKHVDRNLLWKKPHRAEILCNHAVYNRRHLKHVMPIDTVYITILRHPMLHFESSFFYLEFPRICNITGKDNHAKMRTFFRTPEKYMKVYLKSDVRTKGQLIHNGMTFDLGLPRNRSNDNEYVHRYIQNLDKEFNLVMLTERFDESLVMLKRDLCWELEDVVYFKLLERKEKRKELPQDLFNSVAEWNQADVLLYSYFSRKFHQRLQKEGQDFHDEVMKLKQMNEELMARCLTGTYHRSAFHTRVKVQAYHVNQALKGAERTNCCRMVRDEVSYIKYHRVKQSHRLRNNTRRLDHWNKHC